ncbi:MAG: hypothetical protein HY587_00090 [Candidatus Omnitrophica bacterium]|nr:hypothetical protein [Candidatus Omnitrophota bacterium]
MGGLNKETVDQWAESLTNQPKRRQRKVAATFGQAAVGRSVERHCAVGAAMRSGAVP